MERQGGRRSRGQYVAARGKIEPNAPTARLIRAIGHPLPDDAPPAPAPAPAPALSRRQLLATAAWSSPVIILATATPATAAPVQSPSPDLALTFTNLSGYYSWGATGRDAITGNLNILVSGPQDASPPVSSITLQLSFDPLGLTSESGAVLTGGPQWTGGTRTTSSSGQAVYTFLWTDPVGIGANYSTGVLTFRIPGDTAVLNPTPPPKSWQGLATSPTAQSATAVGGTIATPARDEPTPF